MQSFSSRLKVLLNRRATRLCIAALLMGIILMRLDQGALWGNLKRFDLTVGLLMVAVNLLLVGLFALRWRWISAALEIRASYAHFFRVIWLSLFLNQLAPSIVLGEWTRFRSMQDYGGNWQIALSQILDRLSSQTALMGLILLLSPFYLSLFARALSEYFAILFGILLVLGLFAALLFYRYEHLIQRYQHFIKVQPATLLAILNPLRSPGHYAVSAVTQLLFILNFTLAAAGLDVLHDAGRFILLVPLVLSGVTVLPISFADWGTREAVAIFFYSAIGMKPEEIVAVSVIFGIANLLTALPGCLFLTFAKEKAKHKKQHFEI